MSLDKVTDPKGRIWDAGIVFCLLAYDLLPTRWDSAWLHGQWSRFEYGL